MNQYSKFVHHCLRTSIQFFKGLNLWPISSLQAAASTSRDHRTSTYSMCTTRRIRCLKCQRDWMALVTPCKKDRNFSNCPDFKDRTAHHLGAGPFGIQKCPKCDKEVKYDTDKLRMVIGTTYGVRLGQSASRRSGNGAELICCTVM